jgi:hypothetical protein
MHIPMLSWAAVSGFFTYEAIDRLGVCAGVMFMVARDVWRKFN